MRESTIESYLKKLVAMNGGTTRKFTSPGRRNEPDQIVIWPWDRKNQCGRVHFIETKATGKKARPAQEREHNRLRVLGCVVEVLDTKAAVDFYVERNRR